MSNQPFNPDKALLDFELDDEPDAPQENLRAERPEVSISQRCMLSVECMDIFGEDGEVVLANIAPLWVRVVCIRMLLLAISIDLLDRNNALKLASAFNFVRISNVLWYLEHQGVDALLSSLGQLLVQWESDLKPVRATRGHIACPRLRSHIKQLAKLAQLDEIDEDLLLFFVLAHSDLNTSGVMRMIGRVNLQLLHVLLSHGIGKPLDVVLTALGSAGRLVQTHLLTLDATVGPSAVISHYDLPSHGFAAAMCRSTESIEKIAVPLAVLADEGQLQEHHFTHIQNELNWMCEFLRSDSARSSKGVNILLYGRPGVGKSELARLLSKRAGKLLVEIKSSDNTLTPCGGKSRLRGYQIAQAIYATDTVFLIDECEDLLSINSASTVMDLHGQSSGKAWVISLLENSRPTVWVCNNIDDIDPAILRRFQFCLQMQSPPECLRQDHIQSMAHGILTPETVSLLAKKSSLSLGVTQTAIQTVSAIEDHLNAEQRSAMVVSLANQHLRATGQKEIRAECDYLSLFNTAYVNSDPCIELLLHGLSTHRDARLLLYGPPGTGKTIFGKFLAQRMNCETHHHKTSELLSKYVGESEHRLSRAFARAKSTDAILHFDEVDSILMDRQHAVKDHEVTLVNTFLEELDAHTGIVVATTNRMHAIDPAALRRFDVLIKLDFMDSNASISLFQHACSVNCFDEPNEAQLKQVAALDQLTPGDFDQLRRQSRFLPLKDTQDFVDRLIKSVRSKKRGVSSSMGFLHVA